MKKESTFWILSIIGACAIFSSTMSKNPVLPLFSDYLGASKQYIGLISAASTIPGILVSMPAGVLSDVYGRNRMLKIAVLIFASAPFFYLLVSELWQLAVIRVYHGFATAIFGPVAIAAVAERYTADRAARIGLFSSFTMAGRMIAPAVGGFLLTMGSFSSVYGACAAGGVIALVLSFSVTDTWPEKLEISAKENLRSLVQNKQIMITTLVEAFQYFTFGGFETFLPLYAKSVGIGTSRIGIMFSIQLGITMLSKPAMGKISDTIGRSPAIFLGLICGSGSLLTISYADQFVWVTLAAAVYGLGLASVTASTSALVSDLSGGSYGSAIGILSMLMDVGHASGPIITGIVIQYLSYKAAFTLLAALLFLVGFLFYAVFGSEQIQRGKRIPGGRRR
jgi:MFS family permease